MCRHTLHLREHHAKALEGCVASDRPLRASVSLVSCSKGISQSPVQFPEGQSEAPKAEQLPAQLAPSPQVARLIVLFWWQQFTVTDWLTKVKTLSKKSTEVEFVFPEESHKSKPIWSMIETNLDWWCFDKRVGKESMEPSQLGRQRSCCLRTREPCRLGSGIFWHTSKRGRSPTIRSTLATHRQFLDKMQMWFGLVSFSSSYK